MSSVQSIITLSNNPNGILAILIVTFILVQCIKQTQLDNKWMPLVSVSVGLVIGLIIGCFTSTGFLFGAVDGIISGFSATGLFSVLKSFTKE